jgi:hypothetical protein
VESTLADNYRILIGEVGDNLGYGKGVDNGEEEWSDNTHRRLKSYVKSGLRQFYFPPPDGSGQSYKWSFLCPLATLTVTSGSETVDLPDDFGGVEGKLYVHGSEATSNLKATIDISGRAREMHAHYPSATGFPRVAEIEHKRGTTEHRSNRARLVLWPTPDAGYTIKLRYNLLPAMLTGDLPYAYGGVEHAETLLASCLAIAEERAEDLRPQDRVHGPKFMVMLRASISRDRLRKGDTVGLMRDLSDGQEDRRGDRWRRFGYAPLTYNGDSIE